MTSQLEQSKKILVTMAIACMAAIIISAVSLAILSLVMLRAGITGMTEQAAMILIKAVSCLLAGFLAGKRMKTKRFLWGLAVGGVYVFLLILLRSILGEEGVLLNPANGMIVLCCLLSGMLGGMIS